MVIPGAVYFIHDKGTSVFFLLLNKACMDVLCVSKILSKRRRPNNEIDYSHLIQNIDEIMRTSPARLGFMYLSQRALLRHVEGKRKALHLFGLTIQSP